MMSGGNAVAQAKGGVEPPLYAPSWADRLTAYVTRLRWPTWLSYFGIRCVLPLLQVVVLWGEGAYAAGTLVPSLTFLAALVPFLLGLFDYLGHRAAAALNAMRPALKAEGREYNRLRYQLTTLPARPALLASVAGVALVVLTSGLLGTPTDFVAPSSYPISAAVILCTYLLAWWVAGPFMYHTIHQLRVINHIYSRHAVVNLFQVGPLYAFSSIPAVTAVILASITYGWYLLNPVMLSDPTALAISFPISALALAAFAWPLLGIHRLLAEEKERALREASLRMQAAIEDLHQRVDSGKLEGMDDLSDAISSLQSERDLLEKIPTWPWKAETVPLLVSALALPLALWITQYALQRLLGP